MRGIFVVIPLDFCMAYDMGLVLLVCDLAPSYGFYFVLGGMCPLPWFPCRCFRLGPCHGGISDSDLSARALTTEGHCKEELLSRLSCHFG